MLTGKRNQPNAPVPSLFTCLFDYSTLCSTFHASPSSVLQTLTGNPISALYTSNPNAVLGAHAGLRQYYEFGLYSYCGFVSASSSAANVTSNSSSWVTSGRTPNPSIGAGAGICTSSNFNRRFTPYDYLTSDMLSNYTSLSDTYIPETAFRNSAYLSVISGMARWTLLLGTIACAISAVVYVFWLPLFIYPDFLHEQTHRLIFGKTGLSFSLATLLSLFSAICLLIASTTYTIVVNKCRAMNFILLSVPNSDRTISVGIVVNGGRAIALMWSSFACMMAAIIPFLIS